MFGTGWGFQNLGGLADGVLAQSYPVTVLALDADSGIGPLVLIGIALLVGLPVLVILGVVVRGLVGRASPSQVQVQDPSPIQDRDNPISEFATETILPNAAGEQPARAPRRVTTQALRSPPRSGRAKIMVLKDSDGLGSAGPEEFTGRHNAGLSEHGHKNGAPADMKHLASGLDRLQPNESAVYSFTQGDLMRLGREADNDVVLVSKTVHRYHAVIRRSPEAGYVLIDLSGEGGNGAYLNGDRIHDAQLQDGDEFTLGTAKLKFIVDH